DAAGDDAAARAEDDTAARDDEPAQTAEDEGGFDDWGLLGLLGLAGLLGLRRGDRYEPVSAARTTDTGGMR
ncbi:MAG: WGxxGxxG-CTERM domain-containing protein, partial [Pseudomonadota bacterium]|nr:WGxxGxxG-CTERM domain-containing protein [Pseudomonadota bacterium]